MKSSHKWSKSCNVHGKTCEISGPNNFWTSVESSIPDVWEWNFSTLFGSKIEVGWSCSPRTPLHLPPHKWLRHCYTSQRYKGSFNFTSQRWICSVDIFPLLGIFFLFGIKTFCRFENVSRVVRMFCIYYPQYIIQILFDFAYSFFQVLWKKC